MISMLVMTSYLSRTALISFPLFLQEYFTEFVGAEKALLYKNSTDFISIAVRWRNGSSMNATTSSSMRNFNSGQEQYDCKFAFKGIS